MTLARAYLVDERGGRVAESRRGDTGRVARRCPWGEAIRGWCECDEVDRASV